MTTTQQQQHPALEAAIDSFLCQGVPKRQILAIMTEKKMEEVAFAGWLNNLYVSVEMEEEEYVPLDEVVSGIYWSIMESWKNTLQVLTEAPFIYGPLERDEIAAKEEAEEYRELIAQYSPPISLGFSEGEDVAY